MADILIKGLELPKSCEDCFACYDCSYEGFDYCNILTVSTTRGERRKDCPLVEVKPHGRLIDADALPIKDEWTSVGTNVIWDAPTVLEANG